MVDKTEQNDLPLSQFPTTQILENFLVWDFFDRKTDGFFVEIGANDPFIFSQTWLLEKYGWKGVLVEPLAQCCELLRTHRINSRVFQVACSSPENRGQAVLNVAGTCSSLVEHVFNPNVSYEAAESVTVRTLDDVLEQVECPNQIDFLSVDTEGTELDVLKGFDIRKYKPSLVLVEYHVYSLKLHKYLRNKSYKLIRRTSDNNWYIPESREFPLKFVDRMKLFRKMYLGTALRNIKLQMKTRAKQRTKT